jgi:MoxR-like ATPase
MTWAEPYRGDGVTRRTELPPPPPWRTFPRRELGAQYQPPPGLIDAVNAALCLRRPLLLSGPPGSGKSTVAEAVAAELDLGPVLRWNITSRSSLHDGLYRYDVLGRIHAHQLGRNTDNIAPFLRLGPLGTALAAGTRPRALVIDEIDKSDLDLPSDLLEVLERGEYSIHELTEYEHEEVAVRGWNGEQLTIIGGRVQCTEFPFIVLTDNGEREFPAPFLRRCIRYPMPPPDDLDRVKQTVRAHLADVDVDEGPAAQVVEDFVARVGNGDVLALDQLISAVFLVSGGDLPSGQQRDRVLEYVLRELSGA